ncbi:MAG: CHAT domain-containing protein [Pyrinomonadaceae bacterium]|nr:CHAT domain-containing protein [Pyrinomonadaceae bacterium]
MFPKISFRLLNHPAKKSFRLFSLSVIFLAAQFGYSQNAALESNVPVEREIAAKEKHEYQITLAENQYAAITVEQRGIDVAVRIFNKTDKRAMVQRDSILKTDGRESIDFVAATAGVYRLEIEAKLMSAATGRYSVRLAEIRPSTAKERSLEEARKLHNEAVRLWNAGEYDEALPLATRSLEIRERESGADDIDFAASLANLALIVWSKGDYEKAISLNQRALKIREKFFGTYHHDVARTLHNMAIVYSEIGNYEESIRLFEKAVEIREKILGPDNADLATSLGNLSSQYKILADYSKAEQLVRRALEIKEKTLPPNSSGIAYSLSGLADVYSDKGDEDKALEFYQRALDIWEKALRPDHPDIARGLENLAAAYVAKGDYQQAEAQYRRALNILQKAFGQEHPRIVSILGSLAVLYHRQGDYKQAEPLFQQSVAMAEKTLGKEDRDYSTALYNLAWFYTDKGDYQKAEPLYEQAVSIAEKLFGSQHPDVIIYLNGLARNCQAKGDTGRALNFWTRAHKLSERHAQLVLAANSERQKLLYLNALSGETNQYVSAHLKFAPDDAAALELALTTVFERKGRVSDAMTLEFAALRNRFDPSDQILLDKLKETTAQSARKVLNESPNTTPETRRTQIVELEERKEKLEIEISRRSSEFRTQTQPVTIAAIQSALPENAALVEFTIYRPFNPQAVGEGDRAYEEPRYVAYVVRRKGAIQWKDLGAAKTIDEAIENLRQSLRDPERKDVQTLARAVDEKVMQPVRALLGDTKELLVSPDGELNLIPFEALADERGNYLIENYSFTYLTSGRDLLRMQTARTSKSDLLVIADPTFGTPAAEEKANGAARTKTSARRQKRRSVTAARDLSEVYFAPLSGTAQEARSIQKMFPNATFLTKAQATESAVKQIAAPRILHIATHGFFLEDDAANSQSAIRGLGASGKVENPLLRSGLALAGANRRGGTGDDGILTALEASGLNLWGTKLVVLSACDTGLGEVKNGEGVYGLRRAFVLAGAESLVMSLWSVSDYATRELMTDYYKNLKQGTGRGAALRQVQLEMLKKNGRRHPFYWAAFIQSGEWANLDGKR